MDLRINLNLSLRSRHKLEFGRCPRNPLFIFSIFKHSRDQFLRERNQLSSFEFPHMIPVCASITKNVYKKYLNLHTALTVIAEPMSGKFLASSLSSPFTSALRRLFLFQPANGELKYLFVKPKKKSELKINFSAKPVDRVWIQLLLLQEKKAQRAQFDEPTQQIRRKQQDGMEERSVLARLKQQGELSEKETSFNWNFWLFVAC